MLQTALCARIQTIDERLARLRAERSRLLARASQMQRKRETRRKIVVGGAVLSALGQGGVPPLPTHADLLAWLETRLVRHSDRAVFDFAVQESVAPRASLAVVAVEGGGSMTGSSEAQI